MAETKSEVRSANYRPQSLNLGSLVSSTQTAVSAQRPVKITVRICSAESVQIKLGLEIF